jgi:signal peptidase I
MQCSNCQFENMPGVQACGRCGASLRLASLTIDVHPPRARRLTKFHRRWFPLAKFWNRLAGAAARVLPAMRPFPWPSGMPAGDVLLRVIVPGWPQWHTGLVRRAKWMFWSYLGLLLSGLLFAGTLLGWSLLGLAMALHAASIMDIVAARIREVRQRLLYAAVTVGLLTTVVYYPAGWLLAQVATPQRFGTTMPPFVAGDVVLVNHMAYNRSQPEPGDVVLYQVPPQDIANVGHAIYRVAGDRIDRVIARAGQKVTFDQGKLLVDGEPSPWLPLNPQHVPDGLAIAVPENCYLILPSVDPFPHPLPVWQTISIVPRGQIGGRVYWRNQPLWRFGPIR